MKKCALAVLPLVFFLAGCASTGHARLKEDWKNPKFAGGKAKKILAVVMSNDQGLRQDVEKEFMQRTYNSDVEVGTAHTFIPDPADVTKERLIQIVKDKGFDSVLFVRPIIGTMTRAEHSYAADWYTNPELTFYGNPWTYYSANVVTFSPIDAPKSLQSFREFDVETMMYSAADESLVWTAVIHVVTSRETLKAAEEYTVTVWNRLGQMGLI